MDRTQFATTTGLPPPPAHTFPVSCRLSTSFAAPRRRARVVVVQAGLSQYEPNSSSRSNSFGGLNTPLVPESATGRFLSWVFQNQRQLFHMAATDELRLLAQERDCTVLDSGFVLNPNPGSVSVRWFVNSHYVSKEAVRSQSRSSLSQDATTVIFQEVQLHRGSASSRTWANCLILVVFLLLEVNGRR